MLSIVCACVVNKLSLPLILEKMEQKMSTAPASSKSKKMEVEKKTFFKTVVVVGYFFLFSPFIFILK